MSIHDRRVIVLGLASLTALSLLPLSRAESKIIVKVDKFQAFTFSISPTAAPETLLPVPPKFVSKVTLVQDLADAAEVAFEAELPRITREEKAIEHVAYNIAKIHHLSKDTTDGYMKTLLGKRPDLAALPFVLGDDCRQKDERRQSFGEAAQKVRHIMQREVGVSIANSDQATRRAAEQFWFAFSRGGSGSSSSRSEDTTSDQLSARIAVLMQVCDAQTAFFRKGLVKYLAESPHVDSTRALARLAVFSAEETVRRAAVDALKMRSEKDYTGILRQALRYPLPAVAKRAADALVALERIDQASDLVALLEEPDPRAPQMREVGEKQVPVVRELVKINQHRNCLLCHAPGPLRQIPVPTVPSGFRAIGIRPKSISAPLEGFARGAASLPGSRVDFSVTFTRPPEKTETTKTLLENVLVLDTSMPPCPGDVPGPAGEERGSYVLVALTPEDALKLHAARELGTISVTVRQFAKPAEHKLGAALSEHVATGAIPIPGVSTPSSENGYRETSDLFVRADVTYLRQDFSMMLPVANADPWPEMQRFDFLVRTRQFSEEDAQALRDEIRKAGPSPYRRLAHAALRQLTGRDVEPTAEAWRRVLAKTP